MTKTEAKDGNKDGIETNKYAYQAFYLYQNEAENGDIEAQYNLAILYENDERTGKNLEKAFYWNQKAAENEHIKAQYNLAIAYENGKGTEKNLEKAFYWY